MKPKNTIYKLTKGLSWKVFQNLFEANDLENHVSIVRNACMKSTRPVFTGQLNEGRNEACEVFYRFYYFWRPSRIVCWCTSARSVEVQAHNLELARLFSFFRENGLLAGVLTSHSTWNLYCSIIRSDKELEFWKLSNDRKI